MSKLRERLRQGGKAIAVALEVAVVVGAQRHIDVQGGSGSPLILNIGAELVVRESVRRFQGESLRQIISNAAATVKVEEVAGCNGADIVYLIGDILEGVPMIVEPELDGVL